MQVPPLSSENTLGVDLEVNEAMRVTRPRPPARTVGCGPPPSGPESSPGSAASVTAGVTGIIVAGNHWPVAAAVIVGARRFTGPG